MSRLPQLEGDRDIVLDEAVQAAHRLPAFKAGRLVRSWSGLYDTTPDWDADLGPVLSIDELQVAFGLFAHGFKLSPTVGRMPAQSTLDLPTDLPIAP